MSGLRLQSEISPPTPAHSPHFFVSLLERKIDYNCAKCVLHFTNYPRFMHTSVCLPVRSTPCVWHLQWAEDVPNLLELKLQTVGSCHMGSGNRTCILCKVSKHCNSWAISPPPLWVFRHRWFRKSWWSNMQTVDKTMDAYYCCFGTYWRA